MPRNRERRMAWTLGALMFSFAQLLVAAGGPSTDSSWPDERLSTLAFGSCSKPLLPQPLWKAINEARPQMWIWTGDAVYLGRDQPEGLREAYQAQLAQPGYRALLNSVHHIDGGVSSLERSMSVSTFDPTTADF